MKKFLVIVLLVACLAAVAYASLSTNRKKQDPTNKIEKKEVKEKKHNCWLAA